MNSKANLFYKRKPKIDGKKSKEYSILFKMKEGEK